MMCVLANSLHGASNRFLQDDPHSHLEKENSQKAETLFLQYYILYIGLHNMDFLQPDNDNQ